LSDFLIVIIHYLYVSKYKEQEIMAKTREVQCIHYICEGNCDLGKEGIFRKRCQTCKTYKKLPGGKPARTDTRKQRKEAIDKKAMKDYRY
jgi:hypothetical protein